MTRIPPMVTAGIALVVALGACSDTATTSADPPPLVTTGASSTGPPTTPPTAAPASRPAPRRLARPTDALQSFRGSASVTLSGQDAVPAFETVTTSTYRRGDFDCSQRTRVGGIVATQAAVVRSDGVWLHPFDGTEFVRVEPQDDRVAALLAMCPGVGVFWSPFDQADLEGVVGEDANINGVPALRIDLDGTDPRASGLVPLAPGAEIEALTLWVADVGGYPVSVQISFVMTPEAAERDFGVVLDADVVVTYRLDITDQDDPNLTVTPP